MTPIHTAVAGRARLRVVGLCGNEMLKARLEALLPDDGKIYAASASVVTGNVLVRFEPGLPVAAIVDRLERVLRSPVSSRDEHDATPKWHSLPTARVFQLVESGPEGLTSLEAVRRSSRYGSNMLPRIAQRSPLAMLIDQFRSGPVAVLGFAAVLAAVTGGGLDAAIILGVIAVNSGIGVFTESKTEAILGSLRLPLQRTTPVQRDGNARLLPVGDIVPGDLLLLRAGVTAPADARILKADALTVDEAMLTGESVPVAKTAVPVAPDAPLPDRTSMIYRGTVVAEGSGAAVVVATGRHTEAGRIQDLVTEAHPPATPMQRQLESLSRQIVIGCALVCGFVLTISLLRGRGVLQALQGAVALGVAAVPEGLPTLATTALALGIDEMRRHHVVVRRLDAVETLAAVDVIAFDKTGTLTRNQMSAAAIICNGRRVSLVDDEIKDRNGATKTHLDPDIRRLLEVGALCSEAEIGEDQQITGSATEAALVRAAVCAGIDVAALRDRWPMQAIAYRSDARQFIKTLHVAASGRRFVAVKGNPEQVLSLCLWHQQDGRRDRLSEAARQTFTRENQRLAGEGLRVLGVAYAEPELGADDEPALTWNGLIGLADAARQGASALLACFGSAGVRVIMLTGDQAQTAAALARDLGLGNGGPIDVVDFDKIRSAGDHEIEPLVQRSHVFARVAPADKLRIVRALQTSGHVVAMTGDGVNDSPALRSADVGIVMGRSGTEAARDVADIVLQADDLQSIATALGRGRTTYGNIRKGIHYLLATNLSEILVILVTAAFSPVAPLSPIQLLWINLLSDIFPALALAFEPPERNVLEEPPRDPREPLMTPNQMRLMAREGAVIASGSLAAYGFARLRPGSGKNAGTVVFSSLVGAQLLHALTCRSPSLGFFSARPLPPNPPLAIAISGSAVLQLALLTVPMLRRFMGLTPLGAIDALIAGAGAVIPYLVNEAAKIPDRPGGLSGVR